MDRRREDDGHVDEERAKLFLHQCLQCKQDSSRHSLVLFFGKRLIHDRKQNNSLSSCLLHSFFTSIDAILLLLIDLSPFVHTVLFLFIPFTFLSSASLTLTHSLSLSQFFCKTCTTASCFPSAVYSNNLPGTCPYLLPTQIQTINVSNGWVDLYDTPIFSSDSKYAFVRLPSLQSQFEGSFKHIFRISIDVSFSYFL